MGRVLTPTSDIFPYCFLNSMNYNDSISHGEPAFHWKCTLGLRFPGVRTLPSAYFAHPEGLGSVPNFSSSLQLMHNMGGRQILDSCHPHGRLELCYHSWPCLGHRKLLGSEPTFIFQSHCLNFMIIECHLCIFLIPPLGVALGSPTPPSNLLYPLWCWQFP